MAHLQGQAQIQPHQRIAGGLAEVIPEPVLAVQVHPFPVRQFRRQRVRQRQRQSPGRLHDGLGEMDGNRGGVGHVLN